MVYKNDVLVIIDMQPDEFESARKRSVVDAIIKLIKDFKSRNDPIILVEYANSGSTDYKILSELNEYDKKFFCEKDIDDGSGFISRLPLFFRKRKVNIQYNIDVCGVNSNACVRETVEGLSKKYPKTKIRVIKEACNNMYKESNYYWVPQLKNTFLI